MSKLAAIALALPDVAQGIACAGTALESRTFLVKGKAFLFVSADHARFKLGPSAGDARNRGVLVGSGGWAKLALDDLPPRAILERWFAESHQLVGGGRAAGAARAVRKPAKRKRS